MCDPLTIAGAALTVGSTVANAAGMRSAARARDQALAAERIRQRGFDQEAQSLNTQSQDRYQNFEGQRETKAAELGDYLATAQATPTPDLVNASAATAMPSSANDIVTREMDKQAGRAKAFTDQQAGALAQMRSFGDLLGDTSRLQARDASLVGQIGGFKRGSSNIIPLELEAASRRGQGLRTFGDILGGMGGLALNAGLTGRGGSLFGGGGGGAATRALAPATSARPVPRPASLYPTASGIY